MNQPAKRIFTKKNNMITFKLQITIKDYYEFVKESFLYFSAYSNYNELIKLCKHDMWLHVR
ncbi:hypothetical protein AMS58_17990 [Pseudoalteromonas porphyrae]|nr:hypothetical protein AMS58_17990 [Pseudoalteromonas porphyrae]